MSAVSPSLPTTFTTGSVSELQAAALDPAARGSFESAALGLLPMAEEDILAVRRFEGGSSEGGLERRDRDREEW